MTSLVPIFHDTRFAHRLIPHDPTRRDFELNALDKNLLRRIGWTYIVYHSALIGILILTMPGTALQLKGEKLLELAFIFFIYPALIPSIFICGGLHAHNCDYTLLGMVVQVTFLLAGVAWYLTGGWTFVSFVTRLIRHNGTADHHV